LFCYSHKHSEKSHGNADYWRRWTRMVWCERKPIFNKEAAELELNSSDGLIIRGVEKGSRAEASGLKKKDIIVEFNHKPIDNFVIFCRKLLA
jgi:S1-C subfamily serine protease